LSALNKDHDDDGKTSVRLPWRPTVTYSNAKTASLYRDFGLRIFILNTRLQYIGPIYEIAYKK